MELKKIFKGLALTTTLIAAAASADAQIYVNVRPPRPKVVVTRTVAPSPRHVWVDEDWRWNNGGYVYSGGYWVAPPRAGVHWHPGHWTHSRRGHRWVAGYWR